MRKNELTREADFEEASDGFRDVATKGLDSVSLLVLSDLSFAACCHSWRFDVEGLFELGERAWVPVLSFEA